MASRKEEKERLRIERQEREAAERGRKEKQAKARKLAAAIGILAAIAAAAVLLLSSSSGGGGDTGGGDGNGLDADGFPSAGAAPRAAMAIADPEATTQDDLLAAAKTAKCVYKQNPNEGRTHQDEKGYKFKYKSNPPTSGDHDPVWAEDGAYAKDAEEMPPTAKFVHALEHGRVIFEWVPGKVTDAQLGSLKKLYDDEKYHLIIAPNQTKMQGVVAAVAWDRSVTCDSITPESLKVLRMFHLLWLDQGPENVP